MDDDDRDSHASSENEQDEIMEDADDVENDNEQEEDDNDNDNDNDNENEEEAEEEEEAEPEDREQEAEESQDKDRDQAKTPAADASTTPRKRSTSPQAPSRLRPRVHPDALTAKVYDIVPTMAAPQATSINAMAITPDLRYWMTGGSDGYIRKYDGAGTINGKQLLTVAQRHPFVDSVVKAGVLMSYWENEEPSTPNARGVEDHILSPVYSLAVHSQALWLLAGTEGGGINLQSVRHDEGKRIACLQKHSNAVSVLQLAPDEKSVLSGSWDKNIFDWDLNTGAVTRQFDASGGQISALELRPASGAPIPHDSYEEPIKSETFSSSNARPLPNGVMVNGINNASNGGTSATVNGDEGLADAQGSPAHESLFGSPGESLFGGDNDTAGGGGNPFGDDNDNEFSQAMDMTLQGDSTQDAGALTMTDGDTSARQPPDPEAGPPPAVQPLTTDEPRAIGRGDAALPGEDVLMTNGTDPLRAPSTTAVPDSSITSTHPAQDQAPTSSQPKGPSSPNLVFASQPGPTHFDPTQASESTFFSASTDGTIRIWDRRVAQPVARIGNRPGVPPWCMGACWSPDGNWIYAGRRNGTVEEYNIHNARSGWQPERTLKFPQGSGPVSAVRAMANGRHLICASLDILRLYDLHDTAAFKHSRVPFLIVPGPPKAGVISQLYIDPTSRFMISAAGTRGWEGTNTEVIIGYEIGFVQD